MPVSGKSSSIFRLAKGGKSGKSGKIKRANVEVNLHAGRLVKAPTDPTILATNFIAMYDWVLWPTLVNYTALITIGLGYLLHDGNIGALHIVSQYMFNSCG